MYLSATEAAKKFNISKRFVEILCEQGELEGAISVGGIWLIPDSAVMPENLKVSEQQISFGDIASFSREDFYTLSQVCDILSISSATAKNWIRLKKLVPDINGTDYSKEYIERLVTDIKNGNNASLKSRRNKKSISGKSVYKDYIDCKENIDTVKELLSAYDTVSDQELRLILAHFAITLYKNSGGEIVNQNKWYKKKTPVCKSDVFNSLIFELIGDTDLKNTDTSAIQHVFETDIKYVPSEDTLGFIYISLKDSGVKKGTGTYFTPAKTVKLLIDNLEERTDLSQHTVCDPCCGTGNFLIELINRGVGIDRIYGYDIDPISIIIAKINIFLCCKDVTGKMLDSHIVCTDTLNADNSKSFSAIIGNPPWAYDFSDTQNKQLLEKFVTAKEKNSESFEIFTEKGFNMLTDGGYLAFVLPEALLSVGTHMKMRKFISANANFEFIAFQGNIFSGVQCPAIVLGLKKQKDGSTVGCKVTNNDSSFIINTQRQNECEFCFNTTDEQYVCLNTIKSTENAVHLKDNAVFALGIVTGDNKKYISDVKYEGYEDVHKGSDIFRYRTQKADNFIKYLPDSFQQTAPEDVYRAKEKLLYRFICDMPVFAYDNKQTLSLNSCNILIPKIIGLDIKYILAVLNSSVAAFYIGKRYNSVKLLRSHIEQLPIPMITEDKQKEIITLVDKMLSDSDSTKDIYREIDEKIMDVYMLSSKSRKIITNSLKDKKDYI